jgi:formylglycine-generating enzyme required for sulfatase activity
MQKNPSWHAPMGGGATKVRRLDSTRLPVENVTWYEANDFCARLSKIAAERQARRIYRLPTEAEWEYACRGGSTEPHPFDPSWPVDGSWPEELAGKPGHPKDGPLWPLYVETYPPNPFGLYDMRGNVFEWCNDWFDRTYYRRSPRDDPKGPSTGFLKVVRGWDWVFIGPQCKEFKMATTPWKKNPYIGFRVACELKPASGR